MSSQLEKQDLADMEATIQFELSGDNGGSWYAAINSGNSGALPRKIGHRIRLSSPPSFGQLQLDSDGRLDRSGYNRLLDAD